MFPEVFSKMDSRSKS